MQSRMEGRSCSPRRIRRSTTRRTPDVFQMKSLPIWRTLVWRTPQTSEQRNTVSAYRRIWTGPWWLCMDVAGRWQTIPGCRARGAGTQSGLIPWRSRKKPVINQRVECGVMFPSPAPPEHFSPPHSPPPPQVAGLFVVLRNITQQPAAAAFPRSARRHPRDGHRHKAHDQPDQQPHPFADSIAATCSPIASAAVRPGDSMP